MGVVKSVYELERAGVRSWRHTRCCGLLARVIALRHQMLPPGLPDHAPMPIGYVRELLIGAWFKGMGYGYKLQSGVAPPASQ